MPSWCTSKNIAGKHSMTGSNMEQWSNIQGHHEDKPVESHTLSFHKNHYFLELEPDWQNANTIDSRGQVCGSVAPYNNYEGQHQYND